MAPGTRKQPEAHEERIGVDDLELTQALEAATPRATRLAPLVGGRRFRGGRRGDAGGEALDGPEDDAGFLGSLGEDVVAVEGEAVDVVAVHHGGAKVRVVQGDGVVGAG